MSKKEVMEAVANEVKACRKCRLGDTRTNAVPGEGSLDATILFIGEAPGYWEDAKGRHMELNVEFAGNIINVNLEQLLKDS